MLIEGKNILVIGNNLKHIIYQVFVKMIFLTRSYKIMEKTAFVLRNTEENNGMGYIIGIFRSEVKLRKYIIVNYQRFFEDLDIKDLTIDEIARGLCGWNYSLERGPLL